MPETRGPGHRAAPYGSFEATELYCPTCRRAQPVRQTLLLILPTGNRYDYRCSVCGTSVGSRTDDDTTSFQILPKA